MYNAEELIDMICDAEYTYKGYDGTNTTTTIVSRYSSSATAERAAIAGAVYAWLGNQKLDIARDKSIAELEAKVYTYEKIIANSNFAPMIVKDEVETYEKDNMLDIDITDLYRNIDYDFIQRYYPEYSDSIGPFYIIGDQIAQGGLSALLRLWRQYRMYNSQKEENNV